MKKISILVAGSTQNTRLCAESLKADPNFEIIGILTPSPKPIGRKQTITANPLHEFATEHHISVVTIDKKIDLSVREKLGGFTPDILLVVDFGYIVPKWLLELPIIAPVNIHPSDLPRYRGSSPGQFVLLFGESESAVTLIKMDEKLDHGPIITKLYFEVDPHWTAKEYYAHAFGLVGLELPKLLTEFCSSPTTITPQPDESPTPTAHMLSRDNGFIPLNTLKEILNNDKVSTQVTFLADNKLETEPSQLFNMWRGLTPWPGIWTKVSKDGKETRIKLLELSYDKKLKVEKIQVEGKLPSEKTENLFA